MKLPALFYARRTNNHWLVKRIEDDTVYLINMIEGGKTMQIGLSDFEKAINSNALVYKESESILLQMGARDGNKTDKKK
jgi:hypothetical protein